MKVKEDNVKEWKRYNFQEPIDANKLKSEKMQRIKTESWEKKSRN